MFECDKEGGWDHGSEPPRINHLGRSPRLIDLAHSAPLAAGWSLVNEQ